MSGHPEPDVPIAPMRLVIIAMMGGIVTFAAISVFLAPLSPDSARLTKILLPALAGIGLMEVIGFIVLRTVTLARVRRGDSDPEEVSPDARVFPAYNTLVLIGAAMCEGFGLFGVTIFLLTGNRIALAAAGLALVLLALRIPTADGYRRFREIATNANPYAR